MLTEKEKLEEELKLLKESLELRVITEEEYAAAKARVDAKLKESDSSEKTEIEELRTEQIERQEPVKEEIKEEPVKEQILEEEVHEDKIKEEESITIGFSWLKNILNKKLFYAAIILILIVISWYLFFPRQDSNVPVNLPVESERLMIACSSDGECTEGSIGICKNPGKKDSECEYIEDVEIKLMVLNSNNCFNCGTARILSILRSFYPNINVENIGFETKEGKRIKEKFLITALPAYIFNSSFKQAYNYNKFSRSFNEVNGNFVMKNTAANANYYLNRAEMPNRLDVFLKASQNASLRAEKNLEEFWKTFNGKIILEKHYENAEIVKELGINTFPAFLVNNKIKLNGIHAADVIKENFCRMNELDECKLELSKSLI